MTVGLPWSALIVGFVLGLQVGAGAVLAFFWWGIRKRGWRTR